MLAPPHTPYRHVIRQHPSPILCRRTLECDGCPRMRLLVLDHGKPSPRPLSEGRSPRPIHLCPSREVLLQPQQSRDAAGVFYQRRYIQNSDFRLHPPETETSRHLQSRYPLPVDISSCRHLYYVPLYHIVDPTPSVVSPFLIRPSSFS